MQSHQQFFVEEDDDRKNRFQSLHNGTENGGHRERAASQPPRVSEQGFMSSPAASHHIPSSLGGSNSSPWLSSRLLNRNAHNNGLPQPAPLRTSTFPTHPQSQFSSTMRDRAFPSTFEDDESQANLDMYDETHVPPSLFRGRHLGQDPSRSRSQSLATATAMRPAPIGSPYLGGNTPTMQSWNESFLSSSLNNIGRFGDIKPPGSSRYPQFGNGAIGRSPINIHSSSPSGLGNGFPSNRTIDISNMSPFVRDVSQVFLDDGPFRDVWAGSRDENGGGSGTTSRRHSVSVVQPRRANLGFLAQDSPDDLPAGFTSSITRRGSSFVPNDDDLANELDVLTMGSRPRVASNIQPPSQPSSLPVYAPLSRSPPARDIYSSINLAIPASYARQRGSPSELSTGGNSPPRSAASATVPHHFDISDFGAIRRSQSQHTPGYLPQRGAATSPPIGTGQSISISAAMNANGAASGNANANANANVNAQPASPYTRTRAPSYTGLNTPISPSANRPQHPQQSPFFPQQMQRRPSDALQAPPQSASASGAQNQNQSQQNQAVGHGLPQTPTSLNDVGKGVPLHAVPNSWPLYIVEFKAGRTDLFYLTDLNVDVRVGDLVIVEADRGRDLGKVVNDSITLGEVEAWQKQQQVNAMAAAAAAAVNDPMNMQGGMGMGIGMGVGMGMGMAQPTPTPFQKDITPKMIYGKASPADSQ